jgi:hypothetical protein
MTYCHFDTTMANAFSDAMTRGFLRSLNPLEHGDEILQIFFNSSDLLRRVFHGLPEHVEFHTSLAQLESNGHDGKACCELASKVS